MRQEQLINNLVQVHHSSHETGATNQSVNTLVHTHQATILLKREQQLIDQQSGTHPPFFLRASGNQSINNLEHTHYSS